jgi:hypothetical protein
VVSERIKVQNFENFRLPYNYVYPYGNYKIDVIEPEKASIRKNKIFEVQIQVYGEGFLDYINSNTNRVHTSFWQVLNTGRVSSGSKDDNSPNLQNIPAKNIFRNFCVFIYIFII